MSQSHPHTPTLKPTQHAIESKKLSSEIDHALEKLKKTSSSKEEQVQKGKRHAERGPRIAIEKSKAKSQGLSLKTSLETNSKNVFDLSQALSTPSLSDTPSFQDLVAEQSLLTASSSSSIQSLIEKVVMTLTYLRSKDLQNCRVVLKNPPGFENAVLNVKIVGQKCQVDFLNLSEQAYELLQTHQSQLEQHFSQKIASFQLDKVTYEKKPETPLVAASNPRFTRDEQNPKDRRQKKQQQ